MTHAERLPGHQAPAPAFLTGTPKASELATNVGLLRLGPTVA